MNWMVPEVFENGDMPHPIITAPAVVVDSQKVIEKPKDEEKSQPIKIKTKVVKNKKSFTKKLT